MSTRNSSWNVNILAVLAFALLIVLLTSLTKYFEARGTYFSFSAFLYSYPERLPPGAIAMRSTASTSSALISFPFSRLEYRPFRTFFTFLTVLASPVIVSSLPRAFMATSACSFPLTPGAEPINLESQKRL